MIYRLLLDTIVWLPTRSADENDSVSFPSGTGLRGAFSAGMNVGWDDLPQPDVDDVRLRFWFTEAGWRRFGLPLTAQARADGHVVRVLRRKNPRRSDVAYHDRYQVAILPPTDRRERRRNLSRPR